MILRISFRVTSLTQGDKMYIYIQGEYPEGYWYELIWTHWSLGDLEAVLILQFPILSYKLIYFDKSLSWMPYDLTDDKSALFQIMTWYRQAKSNYLRQYFPDLCCHMASLGNSELTHRGVKILFDIGLIISANLSGHIVFRNKTVILNTVLCGWSLILIWKIISVP